MNTQNPHKTKLIVVAHVPLASALLAVVAHVHGEVPAHVFAVDVQPLETQEQVAQQVSALIHDEQALVFTDLMGATPHNGAVLALETQVGTPVIHSVSAPLLLRALNYSHLPAQALHEKLTLG
jgi:mannose PTS system EIIA component